jgi:hypothetical protein
LVNEKAAPELVSGAAFLALVARNPFSADPL